MPDCFKGLMVCLLLLMMTFAITGGALAETVRIKARDGNVYQVPVLDTLNLNPKNFYIQNEQGGVAVVSQEISAELYNAAEALASFEYTINLDTNKIVSEALDIAKLDVKTDGIASIAGVVTGVAVGATEGAVAGATIGATGGAVVGAVGGLGVGAAPGAVVGGAGGAVVGATVGTSVALIDAVSTIATTFMETNAKKAIAYAAILEAETAENLFETVNSAQKMVAKNLKAGQLVNVQDIKDIMILKGTALAHDNAARFAASSLEKDFTSADTAMNFLSNAQPGLSTIGLLVNLSKDASVDSSDSFQLKAQKASVELALGARNEGIKYKDELFGDDSIKETIIYMKNNGFYDLQAQRAKEKLVDENNAAIEEQRLAVEQARLAKEEAERKKAELESQMAKLEKDLNAEADQLNSLTKKLKSAGDINQLKAALDNAKNDYDDKKSLRKMLTRQVDDYKEALKQLTGKIKVYEVTIRGVVYTPKDIPTLQSRIREQERNLNILIREFDKPGGLEESYNAAKDRYNQLVAIERQKQEQQTAIEKAQQELAALEANLQDENKKIEQAQNELLASDWQGVDAPAAPSVPVAKVRGIATCMAIGCEDGNFGISPIELDRKQNETIEVVVGNQPPSTPGNPPSNPTLFTVPLFMGQFRQLPLGVNTERVDPYYLVRAALGDDYLIADWNDLKAAYNSDPAEYTRQWTTGVGTEEVIDPPYLPDVTPNTTNVRGAVNIARNGSLSAGRVSSGGKSFDRAYEIGYHNGQSPSGYAIHDSLGANEYVLGSWIHNRPYLAKKSSSAADYSFDTTAGPTGQENWNGQAVYWTGASLTSSGTVSTKDVSITLNPGTKRIDFLSIDGVSKTIYTNVLKPTSYYYGKNYMGVAYGDMSNYQDPNQEFGWVVTAGDGDLGNYDYMSWGLWQENTSYNNATGALTNTEEGSHWIAGRLTPANEIPTNSVATYRGAVAGTLRVPAGVDSLSGTANLQADFGARTITGQFANMTGVITGTWKTLDVNAGWNNGVNSITGTLSGGGATGTVNGNFFGPQAAELGGTWQTSAGTEQAAGIFRSKKQ